MDLRSEVRNVITNYMVLLRNIHVTAPQRNEKGVRKWDEESLRNTSGCVEFDLERRASRDTLVDVLTVLSATPQLLGETGRRWGILTMDLSLTS